MQGNIVETFRKFNKGQRRPDRRRHLELCGFKLTRVIESSEHDERPSILAKQHIDGLSTINGCYYHGVTLPFKDYHGWTYYEVWTKKL